MKRAMITVTALLAAATAYFVAAYMGGHADVMLTLAISFGTTFYHFAFRLAVGYGLLAAYHNRMDWKRSWFAEKPFEKSLYRSLRVHRWKTHMPTFHPEWFDMRRNTPEEIVMTGCEAEIGHELNVILSLLPIVMTVWFGEPAVFITTSVLGAAFDMIFVIMQRYNRPRLLALMAKKQAFSKRERSIIPG